MRTLRRLTATIAAAGALGGLTEPVVLELPVHEFVALQRLPDTELRRRFNLPEWCDPTIAAIQSRDARITVIIRCTTHDFDWSETPSAVAPRALDRRLVENRSGQA